MLLLPAILAEKLRIGAPFGKPVNHFSELERTDSGYTLQIRFRSICSLYENQANNRFSGLPGFHQ